MMGLADILSNPGIIGLAMAGLSRDPNAPYKTFGVLQGSQEMAQKQAELERQDQARKSNIALLQALMQSQNQQSNAISDAFQSYGNFKSMPSQVVQPPTQNQASGVAVDYETGKSYDPTQTVANPNKQTAIQDFYNKLATLHKIPPLDFTQFQGADPQTVLAAMKQHFETKPADQLMAMIEKQNKPIIVPEGASVSTQDALTGEFKNVIGGQGKDTLEKRKLAMIDAIKANPDILKTMSSEEKSFYGLEGKESNNTETQWKRMYIEDHKRDPNFAKLSQAKQEGLASQAYMTEAGKTQASKIQVVTTAANERGKFFGKSATSIPGVYLDKASGKFMATDAEGNPVPMTTQQAQQSALQYKEAIPTSDILTMQQAVPSVKNLVAQAKKDLAATQQNLGPLAGRWRELWSGTIGNPDPAYRALKNDLMLLDTRLMKMHVGARGGEKIMEHFADMAKANKDSPENISSYLNTIGNYADEVGMSNISGGQAPAVKNYNDRNNSSGNKPKTWNELKQQRGY